MHRKSNSFRIPNQDFIKKCLIWSDSFQHFSYFNPNDYEILHNPIRHFLSVGCIEQIESSENSIDKLQAAIDQKDWLTGFFSYDLKNEIEELDSSNEAFIRVPHLSFVRPRHLLFFSEEYVSIESVDEPTEIFNAISETELETQPSEPVQLRSNLSRDDYLNTMKDIHRHIREGDIYEINYCMEFTADKVNIDPVSTYLNLCNSTPMPFSVLQKNKSQYLISASPERYLRKKGDMLISQPMKGTIRRGSTIEEDLLLKDKLQKDAKERSENVMIVDLVRNDLSRTAIPGSVNVDELFGISSFPTVHQMISTISSRLHPSLPALQSIFTSFPMGSMTGAPKIRAMKLIDRYENSARGWYSGAAGYFEPNGDFDFNVVIRSLVYDHDNQRLSYHAGSAITADSVPEKEYEECLLKVKAITEMYSLSK